MSTGTSASAAAPASAGPRVYISYAWQGESERVANDLDEDFRRRGIALVRDKRDLGYKGLISEFMKEIGRGDAVVLVICDKYLKSDNCMFELLQVARNPDLVDRIFPVVLGDANIYDPEKSVDYIKYWEDRHKALTVKLKSLDRVGHIQGLDDKLDLWDDIRKGISRLTSTLRDMNALTPEMHANSNFGQMIDEVQRRLQRAATAGSGTAGSPPAAARMAAMPASLAATAITGFQEALVDLLDPGSALDSVAVNAVDNQGEETLLALLSVQDGALDMGVMDKAEWAGLQLSPEAWTRINRSGVAGSQRTLGLLKKLNAASVQAEVTQFFDSVFGLPDGGYSLSAVVFDSSEVEASEAGDEGAEGEGEESAEENVEEDAPPIEVDGLDEQIAALLGGRPRQDQQLCIWAEDGQDSICLLTLGRSLDGDVLDCVISLNTELPPPLRLPRQARQAMVDELGFTVDADDGLGMELGAVAEVDPADLVSLVLNVLALGFSMPREDCTLSATLEAR